MADDKKKIDPFDVEALEKSLNDSATRVSTIWVSFLIFSLYLLTAATTVTHRQLFLAEPVKLPVLNIDLPLWGFFFLAPILFVIFHAYVLIQVILLARTAAMYNEAITKVTEHNKFSSEETTSLRQRLANTLFAQILAGSPREREGAFGWVLSAMAWITLAIAPILILLVFQFMFLPYHSHIATWTHRLLIVAELAVAFLLWPLVLDARRDLEWPRIWMQLKRTAALPLRLIGSKNQRHDEWVWLRQQAIPLALCVVLVSVSLSLAAFPGEPHVNLFTAQAPFSVQCERWAHQQFSRVDLRFDRLVLPLVDVVDDEKLAKIVKATSDRKLPPYRGERIRNFSKRDLNCSDLSSADLRRVDLTDARMTGITLGFAELENASLNHAQLQGASLFNANLRAANLYQAQLPNSDLSDARLEEAYLAGAHLQSANLTAARLQGATLSDAQLQGASLNGAQLQGASLKQAQLQGSYFDDLHLEGASLDGAYLQGASLNGAQLQGASLDGAQLQGASLDDAQLQGASLNFAQLQGASLNGAQLQGASLDGAQLQGASLDGAQLQGASLNFAQLQGADFRGSSMTYAMISDAYVWRARGATCRESRVSGHIPGAVISPKSKVERGHIPDPPETIPLEPDKIVQLIEQSVEDIVEPRLKEVVRARMRSGLVVDPANDDTAAIMDEWRKCEREPSEPSQKELARKRAEFLSVLACEETQDRKAVTSGIVRNWVSNFLEGRDFSARLARGLLGEDGHSCAAANDFTDKMKEKLRAAIARGNTKDAAPAPGPAAAPAQ